MLNETTIPWIGNQKETHSVFQEIPENHEGVTLSTPHGMWIW